MRPFVLRLLVAALSGLMLTGASAAPSDSKRAVVDEILTRAVIERGAMLACSHIDTTKETADLLIQGWRVDLEESTGVLRAAGYSDDEVRALTDRFDIEKAAPKFTDIKELGAYCNVLGDWRTRWARLSMTLPQVELRRLLKPENLGKSAK
jgi:hypothetical protein